ncbi:hypothetical protein QHH11_22820 [Aphanizomenon sp. PH219]|nr:hypothetical protein [Aphanizomenon sp. 202]MDK2461928.1 hypothetical protein [Aphanizomenon sp. PH219]
MARQEALMQEARVKRVWAILLFFTQIGFIVFTYLDKLDIISGILLGASNGKTLLIVGKLSGMMHPTRDKIHNTSFVKFVNT